MGHHATSATAVNLEYGGGTDAEGASFMGSLLVSPVVGSGQEDDVQLNDNALDP